MVKIRKRQMKLKPRKGSEVRNILCKGNSIVVAKSLPGKGKSYTSLKNIEKGDVFFLQNYDQLAEKKKDFDTDSSLNPDNKESYIIKGFLRFMGWKIDDNQLKPRANSPQTAYEISSNNSLQKINLSTLRQGNDYREIKKDIESELKKGRSLNSKLQKEIRSNHNDKTIIKTYNQQFSKKLAEEKVIFSPVDLLPTLSQMNHYNDFIVDEGVLQKPHSKEFGRFSHLSSLINTQSIALNKEPDPKIFKNSELRKIDLDLTIFCIEANEILTKIYKGLKDSDKVIKTKKGGMDEVREHYKDLLSDRDRQVIQKFTRLLLKEELNNIPRIKQEIKATDSEKRVKDLLDVEKVLEFFDIVEGMDIVAERDQNGIVERIRVEKPYGFYLYDYTNNSSNQAYVLNSSLGCEGGEKLWKKQEHKMGDYRKNYTTSNEFHYDKAMEYPDVGIYGKGWEDIDFKSDFNQEFLHYRFDGRGNSRSEALNTNNTESKRFQKVADYQSFLSYITGSVGMTGKKGLGRKFQDGDYIHGNSIRGSNKFQERDYDYLFVNGMTRPTDSQIFKEAYRMTHELPQVDLTDMKNRRTSKNGALIGYTDDLADWTFEYLSISSAVEKMMRLRNFQDSTKKAVMIGVNPKAKFETMGDEVDLCCDIIKWTWNEWLENNTYKEVHDFLDEANNYDIDFRFVRGKLRHRDSQFKIIRRNNNFLLDVEWSDFLSNWIKEEEKIYLKEIYNTLPVGKHQIRNYIRNDSSMKKKDDGGNKFLIYHP